MADMVFFVGALVPTFVISRVILLILRKWDGGMLRAIFANSVSLMACALIGGMGMADGGPFAAAQAFSAYLLPQFFWLAVDALIVRRARRRVAP